MADTPVIRGLLVILFIVASCAPAPATADRRLETASTSTASEAPTDPTASVASIRPATPTSASGPRPAVEACDPQQLSVAPIAEAKLVSITPLGNLDPPGHVFPTDHIYLNVPGRERQHEIVPVVAPGPVDIFRITSQQQFGADPFTDYKLEFRICGTLSGHFAHLGKLSGGMRAAFEAVVPQCQERTVAGTTIRACTAAVAVRVGPHEPLGETNPRATGLDFGVFDTSTQQAFINLDRYRTNLNTLGAVCPLDVFAPELRASLGAHMGSADVPPRSRTREPLCGEVMQDRPGMAQGNWFLGGRPSYPEDPHFAFVHDNVDPTRPVMSIGTSLPGLAAGAYGYGPKLGDRVNRDPAEIPAAEGVWCFDGLRARAPTPGRILLSHTSAGLSIEYDRERSCAALPWQIRVGTRFER